MTRAFHFGRVAEVASLSCAKRTYAFEKREMVRKRRTLRVSRPLDVNVPKTIHTFRKIFFISSKVVGTWPTRKLRLWSHILCLYPHPLEKVIWGLKLLTFFATTMSAFYRLELPQRDIICGTTGICAKKYLAFLQVFCLFFEPVPVIEVNSYSVQI